VYRIIKSIMVSCMEMIKFGLPKFNHSTRIVIEPTFQRESLPNRLGCAFKTTDRYCHIQLLDPDTIEAASPQR